jgi:3-keto-5-aminohexanoate cleavage enzyme
MKKLIITAAIIGSAPTRENNPHVPYSPEEIAAEVIRSYDAGACIAHVHVRDPETGKPAFELEYFREVRDRVRPHCDILLNFTTSALHLSGDRVMEQRVSPTTLGPEICTLDISSMNLRDRVFVNPPDWGPYCARVARERGVKPELECFDVGHITLARKIIDQGLVDRPYLFQIVLGTAGGIEASLKNFLFMIESLPARDVEWTAFGVGRHCYPIAAMSIVSGGHVRVGFEDNVYLSRGVLAKSNAELVGKAVRLAREFGREIATPADARQILNVRAKG